MTCDEHNIISFVSSMYSLALGMELCSASLRGIDLPKPTICTSALAQVSFLVLSYALYCMNYGLSLKKSLYAVLCTSNVWVSKDVKYSSDVMHV